MISDLKGTVKKAAFNVPGVSELSSAGRGFGSIPNPVGNLNNTPLGDLLKSLGMGGMLGGSGAGAGAGAGDGGARPELQGQMGSVLTAKGNLSKKYKVGTPADLKAQSVKMGHFNPKEMLADTRALDAMRERATATGESPWLKMQLAKQGLEETSARDQAAQQAMSGGALAQSALAMKGGLGGGSRERIAMNMGRDMNAARQGIGRAGQTDRLGLGIADEQTKNDLLGQTANLDLSHASQLQDLNKFDVATGLDAQKYNSGLAQDAAKSNYLTQFDANKFNTGNAIGGLTADNANKLGVYGEQMKGYAANQQGNAIAAGGKK